MKGVFVVPGGVFIDHPFDEVEEMEGISVMVQEESIYTVINWKTT